jgi:hypothetical protein
MMKRRPSRITRFFQDGAIIRQGRGVITVMDRADPERTSCECYGKDQRLIN